jgi:hypothetical protein
MSLRTEIRATLEEFAPAAPHLDQDVRATLRSLQRPMVVARSAPRLRVSLSLIAAAMVVALMGGLVLTGRLFMQSNAPAGPPHAINQRELKMLEGRALQLPTLAAGAACPEGPTTDLLTDHHGPPLVFGAGPVYATRGGRTIDAWGTWAGVVMIVDPTVSGLLLVRARDLVTNQVVVFAADPESVDAGLGHPTLVGRIVGQRLDPVTHQFVDTYAEAVLDPTVRPDVPGTWPKPGAFVGIPKSASGCIGFQVDGADFTETYVVNETA